MQEKRIKIENPDRIMRILQRTCQSKLQVMLRVSRESQILIRGRASKIQTTPPGFRITQISERGMFNLRAVKSVEVVFSLMSTKIVFYSDIQFRSRNEIILNVPKLLISIERRKNARFDTTRELLGYLLLKVWCPDEKDVVAPPVLEAYSALRGFLILENLSIGGLCATTRFPSVMESLKRGTMDEMATLVLPMNSPVTVGCEVRWLKKITEYGKDLDGRSIQILSYKVGFEFFAMKQQVRLDIRRFIQQLAHAEAI